MLANNNNLPLFWWFIPNDCGKIGAGLPLLDQPSCCMTLLFAQGCSFLVRIMISIHSNLYCKEIFMKVQWARNPRTLKTSFSTINALFSDTSLLSHAVSVISQRKLMGSSAQLRCARVQAPVQVQRGSGEGSKGSGEGLGGFGAEPGQVQQVPEKVPEMVPRSLGVKPSQVQRVPEKVAEKVPEKVLRIFGARPGQVQQVQQGFQRLALQHTSKNKTLRLLGIPQKLFFVDTKLPRYDMNKDKSLSLYIYIHIRYVMCNDIYLIKIV